MICGSSASAKRKGASSGAAHNEAPAICFIKSRREMTTRLDSFLRT
jgi:hypothetical protein